MGGLFGGAEMTGSMLGLLLGEDGIARLSQEI